MRFNSISLLVEGSNNQSIKNDDHIFYDDKKKEFYTANRLVSKCHQVINYLCDKIIKLEEKLPNLFRSTKIISIAKSYLNRHMPANDMLSDKYNMPSNSNKLLTGETLKDFIRINKLDPPLLRVLHGLISYNASIHDIERYLNSIDQDYKTKFLNSKLDGYYPLSYALHHIKNEIENKGEITQYHKDIIQLLIENGANITNVDAPHHSVISRAINDEYPKDLIKFLIDIAPADSLYLQKSESYSVLSKAISRTEEDPSYSDILEKIATKGIDYERIIDCNNQKADKQLIDKLLSKSK
jgi:hypothetical protein